MASTLTSKPLDFFRPDPGNPRVSTAIEELRELRDSLCKRQFVPLLAKPDGTILDGWRSGLRRSWTASPNASMSSSRMNR